MRCNGPTLCPQFQTRVGDDAHLALFNAGCHFENVPSGLYKMWTIPLMLKTTPQPKATMINDSDPAIRYHGQWTHNEKRGMYEYGDDAHVTNEVGASAEMTFTGTGVDYIAEKNGDYGPVSIYLDSVLQKRVSLQNFNFPRPSRVTMYSARGLTPGSHTIKIVNQTGLYAVLDAFSVMP